MNNTLKKTILQDTKKNGKPRDWDVKKKNNSFLGESMKRLANEPVIGERFEGRAVRVDSCANWLDFKQTDDGRIKLKSAIFCKIPLCPMCAWRRSEKIYSQVNRIVRHIEETGDEYRYIMITLTVRNVDGVALPDAMDKLIESFNRMRKRKLFENASKGWYRALEVTYNWETKEYHPHLHVLMMVNKEYITKKENYISHEALKYLWQDCARLDYEPWVRIQKIRKGKSSANRDVLSYNDAIAEVAKYTTKSTDYLLRWEDKNKINKQWEKNFEIEYVDGEKVKRPWEIRLTSRKQAEELTDSVVSVLDIAFHGRRMIGMGGLFKKVHHDLNLEDAEDADLIVVDGEDETKQESGEEILRYYFVRGINKYFLFDKQELPVGYNGEVFVERGP